MEAVIPTEIGLPTILTATPESENAESIARELDVSDELRETAAIRRWVKPRVFRLGDLILRKVFENTADPTTGKFQPI